MTITLTMSKLAIAVLAVVMLVPATAMATHVFTDVPDDKFYAAPVEWAFDNDITTGKTPTSFAPDDNVTRGESVTFLKRYEDNIVAPADAELQDQIDALEANTASTSDLADKADADHSHDDRYVVGEALDGGQLVLAGQVNPGGGDPTVDVGNLPPGITVEASNPNVGTFSVSVRGVDGSGGTDAIRAIVTPTAGQPTVCYQGGSGAGPEALSATIKCALVDGTAVDIGFNFMLSLQG